MLRQFSFWLALMVAVVGWESALADNPGQPMTFRYYPARPNFNPEIQADGEIQPNSPALLDRILAEHQIAPSMPIPERPVVFFMSPGGDLEAGMAIGRIIRRYRLDTKVGAHEPVSMETRQALLRYGIRLDEPDQRSCNLSCMIDRGAGYHPSYCISSCTLAFLGGVTRSMVKNSAFAVHQYDVDCKNQGNRMACADTSSFLSAAQQLSAEIASYLETMGSSQSFLTNMVLASPDQVNALSESDMWKYRILDIPSKQRWEVKQSPYGGLVLVFDDEVAGSQTHVEFVCTPHAGNPELALLIAGDHHYDRSAALSAQDINFSFYPDNTFSSKSFPLSPDEVIRYPYQAEGGAVGLTVRATGRIIDALRRTDVFSITSYVGPDRKYVIFANVILDKDKVDGYIASCR